MRRGPVSCRTTSVPGPARSVSADARGGWQGHVSRGPARVASAAGDEGDYQLCWNSNVFWLASPEGDDAPDGIVRRHADGHAISRDNLDAKAAHAAAELGEHFVAGVALHAVKPSTMNRHDRTLHVNEIVLAQTASIPFMFLINHCATCTGSNPRNWVIRSLSHRVTAVARS